MGALIDKLKDWWLAADQTQKLVTGFGVVFLLVILGFTVFFSTRPKMSPVFTGMNSADANAVYEELGKSGFKVEIAVPSGDVVVPTQDVARARMVLAGKNKLPKNSEGGIDIIETIGIGDSQRKEGEKILAAKERELENSISTMQGIAAAQVHLNLGKDGPFTENSAPPSASIRITELSEGAITDDQGKAIARLVEFAITNLKSTEISVVTDAGRMVYDGKNESSTGATANGKIEAENLESDRRTKELQAQLDQVFGRKNTIVDIDVTLNMDTTAIETNAEVTAENPKYVEKAEETLEASAETGGGTAGFVANGGGTAAANSNGGDNKNYGSTATASEFPTTTTKTVVQKAAGDVVAMNIKVLANTANLDETTVRALEDHVNSYIAPFSDRPEFQATVTPVEFNNETETLQQKAEAEAANAARMQQLVSLLPVGALLLVGIILVRSLTKTLAKSSTRTMVLSNGQTISLPANASPELIALVEKSHIGHDGAALESMGVPALDADGNPVPQEEEFVFEDTGEVTEEGEPIVVRKKKKRRPIEEDDDDDDIHPVGSIKRKVDVPLEQIKKMSKKNPEAVAMLLKGWVMEERS